jgi:hypothetical protein
VGGLDVATRATRSYKRRFSFEDSVSRRDVAEIVERRRYQLQRSNCGERFPLRRVHPLATLLQDSQRLSWSSPGKASTSVFDPQLAQRLARRLDVDRTGALGERGTDEPYVGACRRRTSNAE